MPYYVAEKRQEGWELYRYSVLIEAVAFQHWIKELRNVRTMILRAVDPEDLEAAEKELEEEPDEIPN